MPQLEIDQRPEALTVARRAGVVVCDERVNRERHREQGVYNLLFGIPAQRPGGFHAWVVSHRAGGSRVRTVSPNLSGLPDIGLTQVLAELDLPPD